MNAGRSLLALSLSAALGATGCTKSDDEAGAKTKTKEAVEPKGETTPVAKGEETAPVQGAPTLAPVGNPSALAAAVESMVEAEGGYPMELDPLLDLLPAGSDVLVVIRDLDDLLALADATLVPMSPSIRSFAAVAGDDAPADVDKFLTGYERLQAGLRGGDFDLDKGIAVSSVGENAVVIYGASSPDALPTLLRSLGAEGDDLPDDCAAVEGAPGYAVCASEPEVLATYAPAKAAASIRARLATQLEPKSLERANLLALVAKDPEPSRQVVLGVATAPGLMHVMVGLGEVPAPAVGIMGVGESPGLGLIRPGGGFYWLKVDPTMIAERTKDAPIVLRATLSTLTGEVVLGTVADPNALVVLAGVNDPIPAGGLIAMAGLKTDALPKTLGDGSSLDVGVETLTIGGKDTQVLHATLKPAGEGAALLAKMGFVPEAWMFAVGSYVGVAFGSDKTVVDTIASYGGGVMSSEAIRTLPKPLAQGLVDKEIALAVHLPLDGMQSPQVSESFEMVTKDLPATDLPPGMTPATVLELVKGVLSPVSGISMWMAPPADRMTFHVAYSLIGDPRTTEGKAALDAVTEVAGGGSAASVYGDLATRFASSPHVLDYQARAGTHGDGSLASAAILGVMAAIAVPAFTKYQKRSREAEMVTERALAEAEAEAAAAAVAAEAAAAAAAEAAK